MKPGDFDRVRIGREETRQSILRNGRGGACGDKHLGEIGRDYES
jgi:hypothetical protein